MKDARFTLSSEQTLRLAELRDALAEVVPVEAAEAVEYPVAHYGCGSQCAGGCGSGCAFACWYSCKGGCQGGCTGCGDSCHTWCNGACVSYTPPGMRGSSVAYSVGDH